MRDLAAARRTAASLVVRAGVPFAFALGSLVAAGLPACGNGGQSTGGGGSGGSGGAGGVPCADHPTSCPAGQTCWFTSDGSFACLIDGTNGEGEKCKPVLNEPTCTHNLLCVQEGSGDGVCRPLCDPSATGDTCGSGQMCVLVQAGTGAQTHICH